MNRRVQEDRRDLRPVVGKFLVRDKVTVPVFEGRQSTAKKLFNGKATINCLLSRVSPAYYCEVWVSSRQFGIKTD